MISLSPSEQSGSANDSPSDQSHYSPEARFGFECSFGEVLS